MRALPVCEKCCSRWPAAFLFVVLLSAWALLVTGKAVAADGADGRLPASAALRATVFGPEPDARAALPERVPLRELKIAIDGALPVPRLFWFNRQLRVWLSAQPNPAPLVVVIAGTGGGGDTPNLRMLRGALYGAGYHVLTVPSPSFPGFIVAASSTGVAGDLKQDTMDLRRAVRQTLTQLPSGMEITGMHAVGYSLGGAHAAAMKALDHDAEPLGIERVVMINPPVSLMASIARLDRLFTRSIGRSGDAIDALFQQLVEDLAELYRQSDALTMNESFLLEAAGRLMKSDREFAAAIALSFRLALINMFLVGDYYAGTGAVIDPDDPPQPGDPLDDILRTLRAKPFSDYFDEVFEPYYLVRRPNATRETLVTGSSLTMLEAVLSEDGQYFAQHNRDDFILDANELDWLKRTLGSRIVVYDHGGHLGNLGSRQQIDDMLKMLAGDWNERRDRAQ